MKSKLIKCIFIVIIISIFSTFSAFAAQISDQTSANILSLIKNNLNLTDKQLHILDQKIQNENAIKSYQLSETKRVFQIPSTMISNYTKNKSFRHLISDKNNLYIPMKTTTGKNGTILVQEKDQFENLSWESGQRTSFESNSEISEKISAYFSSRNKNVKEILFTTPVRYHSNLVYISDTDGNEYVLPYFSAIENYNFKNGEIYTASDFIKLLSETIDEDAMLQEDVYSDVVFKDQPTNMKYLFQMLFGILAGIFLIFVLIRKNISHK